MSKQPLGIHEEEQFILYNCAAQGCARSVELERSFYDAIIVGTVTDSPLVLKIIINRTSEFVGSLAGDGIDESAGEIALPDVIRRDLDLDLVDGVQRDGLRVGLTAKGAGKAERVVEVGSVHGDIVHSRVGATEA